MFIKIFQTQPKINNLIENNHSILSSVVGKFSHKNISRPLHVYLYKKSERWALWYLPLSCTTATGWYGLLTHWYLRNFTRMSTLKCRTALLIHPWKSIFSKKKSISPRKKFFRIRRAEKHAKGWSAHYYTWRRWYLKAQIIT